MDVLAKQSRETQVVIGGSALFVILSFFNWQSFDFGPISAGATLWHGLGTLAALLAIALLAWEVVRLLQVKVELGGVSPALVSVTLAGALLIVTVIKFLQANEGRSWPAWVGLIVVIVIAVFAWMRGQAEGVEMPDVSSMRTSSPSGPAATSGAVPSSSPDAPPPAATQPPPVAPPATPGPGDRETPAG